MLFWFVLNAILVCFSMMNSTVYTNRRVLQLKNHSKLAPLTNCRRSNSFMGPMEELAGAYVPPRPLE